MVANPELDDFRRRIESLKKHPLLRPLLKGDTVHFTKLKMDAIASLLRAKDRDKIAYYFLIAAASLNRTKLKKAMTEPDAQIVSPKVRQAYVIKQQLPHTASFKSTADTAVALRSGDLGRKGHGQIEGLFRDRLISDKIPILMSPPIREVPGLLVPKRKPDGVYPDPKVGEPPKLYLEIKNVKRPSDDIQKRLYEIAEASLEMKLIYGDVKLNGLGVADTRVLANDLTLRERLRAQITASTPVVVALFLCPKGTAERYRPGAETFIDRVFFEEEIEECLAFLRETMKRFTLVS